MKLINKIARNTYSIILKIVNILKPFIQKRNYLGYKLYYSKGTSLIERLKQKNSIYEPETCNIIIDLLRYTKNPCFIDIGANIGLISLYVLRNVPNVQIFAFEPGPHQFELFRKTIDRNELEHRISLYKTAISNVKGTLDFFVHNTKDVSGDGFIDTLRAGTSKIIQVPTIPLDQWWLDENKPQIDFIKIDTEGAELWILQGAKELISICKPIILTEMSDLNYINYPYSEIDVLNLLYNYNYIVYNEKREITDLNNLRSFQEKKIYTYYCIPRM